MTPRYPEGTPEYAAYAAELRAELAKWANYEPPYDIAYPDPGKTGPCIGATFACRGTGPERLDPRAMLAGSDRPARYTHICQPCYDTLADAYVMEVHS